MGEAPDTASPSCAVLSRRREPPDVNGNPEPPTKKRTLGSTDERKAPPAGRTVTRLGRSAAGAAVRVREQRERAAHTPHAVRSGEGIVRPRGAGGAREAGDGCVRGRARDSR